MKLIVNGFLTMVIAVSGTLALSAAVLPDRAEAYANNDALMTIRFNQSSVPYQDKLFFIVSEAVKTKPTVIFDVVATSRDGNSRYGKQVATDITRIGVNPEQVTFRTEAGEVSSEEVRIFVR